MVCRVSQKASASQSCLEFTVCIRRGLLLQTRESTLDCLPTFVSSSRALKRIFWYSRGVKVKPIEFGILKPLVVFKFAILMSLAVDAGLRRASPPGEPESDQVEVLVEPKPDSKAERLLVPKVIHGLLEEQLLPGAQMVITTKIFLKTDSPQGGQSVQNIGPCEIRVSNFNTERHLIAPAGTAWRLTSYPKASQENKTEYEFKSTNLKTERSLSLTCPQGTRASSLKSMRFNTGKQEVEVLQLKKTDPRGARQ